MTPAEYAAFMGASDGTGAGAGGAGGGDAGQQAASNAPHKKVQVITLDPEEVER
jgi:hypothetical protein